MSKLLNQLLGVDVRWDRLNKKELQQLIQVFSNPQKLVERLVKAEKESKKEEEVIDREVIDSILYAVSKLAEVSDWDGPVIKILRMLIKK